MPQQKFKRRVLVMLGWNDPRIIQGIGQYAREAGWRLESRQFYTETFPTRWQGDGLIVSNTERADLRAFMRRQAPRQPTVLVGGNNPAIRVPQVTEDNRMAGALAARHVLERGHKHFAWFTTSTSPVAANRHEGFRSTLEAAGFSCEALVYRLQRQSLVEWLTARLRALPRPLAFYVLDDPLAADAIEICLTNGWRVPEDIAVMGNGNIELACECSHVPITSVDLNDAEVGREAAVLLDRLMHGYSPPDRPVILEPRGLVVRRSTDYLAVTDPVVRQAIDHIAAHLHRPLGMEQIADAAGISRRTLYNLFRRDLRRTPAAFLEQSRLKLAKEMLSKPGAHAVDVAARCGLGTTRTLTRLFLRHEGVSIRAWRRINPPPKSGPRQPPRPPSHR